MNEQDAVKKQKSSISILDILFVLIQHRWLIISSSFIAAVLIVGFSIMTIKLPPDHKWNPLPNHYTPKSEILIQQSGESLLSNLASAGSSPLSLLMGTQSNPELELAKKLLAGNTIKDKIIEEFEYIERFELQATRFPLDEAREIFNRSIGFEQGLSSAGVAVNNIFTLSYRDIDPEFATGVLTRVVELLEKEYRDLTLERIYRKKAFIEGRMFEVESEMKKAQQALSDFQLTYGVIDISAQTREQANLIEEIQSDIIKNQLEVRNLLAYLPKDNPRVKLLEQEITQKQQLIEELKSGSKEFSDLIIPQSQIPNVTSRFLELKGELEIKQSIYKMLRNEYEAVKIQENDNSRTFQVVEQAEVPRIKSGPDRGNICMIMTIAVFILSIFIAFLKEYIRKVKIDPVESEKLKRIGNTLS